MKLRFTLEPYHTKAYTASHNTDLISEAESKIEWMKKMNKKFGYKRFSNPILYDNYNKVIKKYNI